MRGPGVGTPFGASSPVGGKADRGRETIRFGGDAVRSTAEAARGGGGARETPFAVLGAE
jgi:hypothetical protein